MLVSVSGDKYASEVYFYDSATKDLILQYTPRPELKAVEQHLSTMKPINYKSSDGLTIPGYLTIPNGATTRNLPTVILVHGCLLYTSPSPRDKRQSRMPSSA